MKIVNYNSRSRLIDVIRGFTVILMIFFHFSFDLNNFGFVKFDILHSPFWYLLPRIIVFLFLIAVGMSLTILHSEKIKWQAFWIRFLKLAFFALIISIVTKLLFPENWIYFGTLHAIAVISLMSLPFLNFPKISLTVALILFLPSIIWDYNLPWFHLEHQSWDYIAPFPWLGASLLGIFAVHKKLHLIALPDRSDIAFMDLLGRHSLFIYLVHQPILFGFVYLLSHFLKTT